MAATLLQARRASVCWLLAGLILTAPLARAQDHEPTSAPAIQPLSVEPVQQVSQATSLTPEEEAALSAVRDKSGEFDEAAMYVLLRRANMLPTDQQTLDRADQVAFVNLLERPERYRGELVRVNLEVYQVTRWDSSALTYTGYWGRRPVWRLAGHERTTGKPMILLLTRQPELAEGEHPKGPVFSAAGFFYKVAEMKSKSAEPTLGVYPVIVAGRLYPSDRPAGPAWPSMSIALAFVLAGLTAAFVMLKRSLSRRARPQPYAPRRDEPTDAEPAQDETVDPELLRQLRQYQAEHRRQDEEGHGRDSR